MIIWILLTLVILLIATLLLRLRVGCILSPEKKVAFVRLGRTASEYDFTTKVMIVKLFGVKIKEISVPGKGTEAKAKVGDTVKIKPANWAEAKPRKVVNRPFSLLMEIVSESGHALLKCVAAIFRAVVVEEAEGDLAFGFDSPDLTGRLFGYYHAFAWVVPSVTSRLMVVPDFSRKVISGRARLTIAVPFYVFVYRVLKLLVQLPILKIIQYARGIQKGADHGD